MIVNPLLLAVHPEVLCTRRHKEGEDLVYCELWCREIIQCPPTILRLLPSVNRRMEGFGDC